MVKNLRILVNNLPAFQGSNCSLDGSEVYSPLTVGNLTPESGEGFIGYLREFKIFRGDRNR